MIEPSAKQGNKEMNNSLTATDREAMPAIFAAVMADEGASKGDIQRVTGCPEYRVRKVLGELRKQGKLSHVPGLNGLETRWYSPEKAAVVRKELDRIAEKKKRARKLLYSRNYNEWVRSEKNRGIVDAPDDWPIERSTALVNDPLPFICTAPASVFAWASSL